MFVFTQRWGPRVGTTERTSTELWLLGFLLRCKKKHKATNDKLKSQKHNQRRYEIKEGGKKNQRTERLVFAQMSNNIDHFLRALARTHSHSWHGWCVFNIGHLWNCTRRIRFDVSSVKCDQLIDYYVQSSNSDREEVAFCFDFALRFSFFLRSLIKCWTHCFWFVV